MRLLFVLFAACNDDSPSEDDSDPPDDSDTDTVSPEVPPGGNVLLLVADDLGVDKIAAYGISATPVVTPNIDSLIATGLRFENAWSLPECGPTRAAMLTGRHARRTGNGANESIEKSENELGPEQTTFVELAKWSTWFTYDTALVGKWHLSTFDSQSGAEAPFLHGFDYFAGTMGNLGIWVYEPEPIDAGYFHWQKIESDGTLVEETTYATTDVVDDAVERLGVLREPWILQVGFHAAHGPYDVPPDELLPEPAGSGLTVREKERLIVQALDAELGRLLAAIPDDVRSRTTIFFLGDNGTPQLAVEPEIDPDRSKQSVYEPGVHVPFVVHGPLVAVPGSTSAALVHVVDVMPTVAGIVGFDVSTLPGVLDETQPLALDGESLLPILADPTVPTTRTALYTEIFYPAGPGPYTEDLRAVRDHRFKLVRDAGETSATTGQEQFFELPIGGTDEGLDLLPCGLDAEQEAAYDRLRGELDRLEATLVFDADWTGELRPPQDPAGLLDDISCAGPP